MGTSLSISYPSCPRPEYPIKYIIYKYNAYLFILKSPKDKNMRIVNFSFKLFISQIEIGYLGRVWVPDPPTDVGMEIKILNEDGNGESKNLQMHGSFVLISYHLGTAPFGEGMLEKNYVKKA